MKITETILVPETFTGVRLDKTLTELLGDYSREQVNEWISTGKVLVDDRQLKPKHKVQEGQAIKIDVELAPKIDDLAEPIELAIIFEDEHLLVLNKPAGLVVHPGAGMNSGTLLNGLLHYLPTLDKLPRAGIVHRLDKDTSGVMVVAKTEPCRNRLIEQLSEHHIKRQYLCLINGVPITGFQVDEPIGRHPKSRTKMAVCHNSSSKPAFTEFSILQKFRAHTLLQASLKTGRTHQIRVHLQHSGYPIVGDRTYSRGVKLVSGMPSSLIQQLQSLSRQFLHAYRLQFEHPITTEHKSFEVDLPDTLTDVIHALTDDFKAHQSKVSI